ncbi:MAG: potassium channel family protein [Acetobacteraceae bacterium]
MDPSPPPAAQSTPRHRLDRHWLRSIGFTAFLVGLVAIATDADWLVTSVSVATSAIGFGFFYLLFPGGAHFGIVTANFLAIYGCLFEFFRVANFPLASRHYTVVALALPVLGFLGTCFAHRWSITRVIHARRLRELAELPRLSRWLMATLAVGAASFALPQYDLGGDIQGPVLLACMLVVTFLVAIDVHDVVMVMVDIAMVFDLVAGRLDRLLMPMMAFLTFYGLLVIVFACLYRIADMVTIAPQFTIHGTLERISFVDGLYYSVVTISTLGFGDISPASMLTRALTGIEVVCGVLMLLFGFSEVMRNAGPDSHLHERRSFRGERHHDGT